MTTPVILTGAGSFLGAYVLKVLDAEGIDTFALSRQAATVCARLGLSERIRPVEIDLSASSMNWLPPAGGPYSIIHLAFDRMASGSSTDGAETNRRITRNILDLRRNAHIATIVNASSTSVYGKPEGGLVSAETAPRSPSEYGTAKLLAEQLLADSVDAGTNSVFSIRLPAVLGAGAHPENWLVRVAQSMQEHAEIAYQSPDFLFNNAVHGAGVGAFFVKLSQVGAPAGDVTFPIGAAPGPRLRDMLERMRDRLESRSALTVHPATSTPFAIDNATAEGHGYKAEPIETVLDRYLDDLAGNIS